ncbi:MAG: lytic transglycosylase domain-containing protein [Anaerolineales bacterium]|nr:lytic transglycosylase domain-containing protein [Anaerolineales bacterium]
MFGPRLLVGGALLGGLFLATFLYRVTASAAYAPARALAATGLESQPALQPQADTSGDGCQVSGRYPADVRRWCEWITRSARARGLSPDLVAALVWLESGGDPQAYSRSGAVGLMQVMPRDGLAAAFVCKNGPCFSDRPTIAELSDPQYNLEYGVNLLADLLARRGSLREALRAYGPLDVGYTYADKVLDIYFRYKK